MMIFKSSLLASSLFAFSSVTSPAWSLNVSKSDIKAQLDQCEIAFNFTSGYFDDDGAKCDDNASCKMCSGSALRSIYDNSDYDTCVDCSSLSNSTCSQFKVFTSFDKAWLIRFLTLAASMESSSDDPSRILLQGSNNFNGVEGEGSTNSWVTLHDSDQYGDFTFADRSTEETIMMDNYQEYKHYAVAFYKNSDSSKIRIGNYGLLQAHNKECTAKVFEDLLGIRLITSAPSEQPSDLPSYEPTSSLQPSDPPTLSLSPSLKPTTSVEPTSKPTAKTTFKGYVRIGCIYNPCDRDGSFDQSDVYVTIFGGGSKSSIKTRTINNANEDKTSCWNQEYYIGEVEITPGTQTTNSWNVHLKVHDYDSGSGDDHMGDVDVRMFYTSSRTLSFTENLHSHKSDCRRSRLSFRLRAV